MEKTDHKSVRELKSQSILTITTVLFSYNIGSNLLGSDLCCSLKRPHELNSSL